MPLDSFSRDVVTLVQLFLVAKALYWVSCKKLGLMLYP